MKKCIGCGKCCKSQVCEIGKVFYKTETQPCPGLLFQEKRYWCGLIKNTVSHKKRKLLESYMTIGFGCEW